MQRNAGNKSNRDTTKLDSLILKDEILDILTTTIDSLKEKYKLGNKQILDLIKRIQIKELSIPVSVFKVSSLGILEVVVKYLKENLNLRYNEIASLLNRDSRTIWATYRSSNKKYPKKLAYDKSSLLVPVSIFRNRIFAPLESIIAYLKDELDLTYKEISVLLNRDNRNIWTSYHTALKKRKIK